MECCMIKLTNIQEKVTSDTGSFSGLNHNKDTGSPGQPLDFAKQIHTSVTSPYLFFAERYDP